ncbi:unnamed protein product [Heligmosomoides polygyrus]|uniref:Uncharacterized protein n=1 Tax=Heligmosomoides polygyrus TaxID=6339 RepID=A0A3P8ER42_HELPZ|nr:unnamed protein product [Heligmosomoides polygyrus]
MYYIVVSRCNCLCKILLLESFAQKIYNKRTNPGFCCSNLETYAKGLPNQLPQIEPLNRLRQLDVQVVETVESMIDCENWNEGNFQTYMYLGEFLRLQRRRPSCIVPRPLSCSHWSTGMSPHAHFETAFAQLLKNKTGIFPTFLERTAVGSIVEVGTQFLVVDSVTFSSNVISFQLRYGVLFEKQIVFTQKMLMVENAGVIEHILFVAPHEEWGFYTDLGEKRLSIMSLYCVELAVPFNNSISGFVNNAPVINILR